MQMEEKSSGLENLAKNAFARVGTVVTGITALATALHRLTGDIILTLEGLVLAVVIIAAAIVILWRSSKIVDSRKVLVPFSDLKRLVAGVALVVAIVLAIPYTLLVTNLVLQREQAEKQLAVVSFLALTPSPPAAATATLTATPPPGAPQTATAVARAAWPLVLSDSFVSNVNGWGLGSVSHDFGTTNRTIVNGKYRIELKAKSRYNVIDSLNMRALPDFFATVDAQRISGPTTLGYGILFRSSDLNNYYTFTLSDDHNILLQAFIDNKSTLLAHLDQVSAIKPGAINHLGVVAEGAHLQVLINDQIITAISDSRLKDGKVGFWVGTINSSEEAVFEFSNLQIRAP